MPNSAKAGKRDPRLEPKPGDVLRRKSAAYTFPRREISEVDARIICLDGTVEPRKRRALTWERFLARSKNAEVIHVADDPAITPLVDECESEGR